MRVKDAAKKLDVSQHTIIALIKRGELKAVDVALSRGKPRWRISEDDLEAFLESRRNTPPAPPKPRHRRQEPDVVAFYE